MDSGEVIVHATGEFGRWQLLIILAIFLSKFAVAWHQILTVIVAPPVKFECADSSLDKCASNCTKYTYDKSIFKNTIIMQWDLVCDRAYLANLAQTFVMLGILVGNVVFGYLSDRFGRRRPLVCAIVLQVAAGSAAAFAPWLPLYIVLRFLSTVATGGTMLTTFVILMEFTAKKYRTVVGVLFQLPFHLGHASLGLIGYLLRDWHHMQMAVSIPQAILISYWCILPESPRWLLALNRTDETVKMLERVARCNRLPTEHIKGEVEAYVSAVAAGPKTKAGNAIDLIRTKRMRTKTICLSVNWFVVALEFFAVAQFMGQIGGNIFINIGAAGLIQVPGNFIAIYVMDKFGRKCSLIFSYVVCFVPCFVIAVIPTEPTWPTTLMGCLSIMGISMSFSIIYVYSGEMLPTVVRNVGMGVYSMIARFGSMISPHIATLNVYYTWLPPLLLGAFPVISSLVTLFFLPETLNVTMPDQIEEADLL